MLEFNLPQAMASPSLEDACYQVDVLEKVVPKEIGIFTPPSDPFEACLIDTCGCGIDSSSDEENEAYVKILYSAQPYLPNTHRGRFLILNFDSPMKTRRALLRWN